MTKQQKHLSPMLLKMKTYQHYKGDFSDAISMGTFEQPKVRQMTIEEFMWTQGILSHGWEYPAGTYEEIENSAMRTGEWMHWTEYRLGDFRITPLSVDSDKNLTLVEIHDFVEMKREYIWVPSMQSKGE